MRRPSATRLLRASKGDAAAGDGGGAGAAVGLDDVAVDDDAVFAQGAEVDGGAQGAADEALDFDGAAALFAAAGFAAHAVAGGAGEHAVFGGDPALALAFEEGWDLVFHAGGADDLGVAEFDEHGAFGVLGVMSCHPDIAKLVGVSGAWTHGRSSGNS